MDQSSSEAVVYCLLGSTGRQIRHSISHLRRSISELHALSTQKEVLSEIAKLPPEQLFTWLESLNRDSKVLADHAKFVSEIVQVLELSVSTIQQEDQATESGTQMKLELE